MHRCSIRESERFKDSGALEIGAELAFMRVPRRLQPHFSDSFGESEI
jgi:hypothetical protein